MFCILITGSNGLLGQKIVYRLLELKEEKNLEIIATSKGENRLLTRTGYTYDSLDISNREQVNNVIGQYKPQCVINTAAFTNVDACETQREECWNVNVTGVKNLVDALLTLAPRPPDLSGHGTSPNGGDLAPLSTPQLIHLSTDFIFDGLDGPYKEDDTPNPLSYYSSSKYEAEKIVQSSNMRWAIARTIIIYGLVDNMSRSNVVLWAKDSLSNKKPINVVNDQFRSPTLAEDLAEGCLAIVFKERTGIYNLSGKDLMSILDLVYKVADFWDLDKSLITPVTTESLKAPAKRPPRTGFILDKAIRELGYNPRSFLEGLKVLDEQLKKKNIAAN